MTIHTENGRTFIRVAVQRDAGRDQLGFCMAFPPALTERFVEDDTETLCFEILRLPTGYHLKLIDEIPENPERESRQAGLS